MMRVNAMFKSSLTILALSFLSGCSEFGTSVLRSERTSYNEAVHDTSAEQLLLNVVRASKYEAPSFSDFVEFDSTPSTTLQVGGSASSIGATPVTGAVTPTLSAGESSVQKNVSVTGAQLTQQIASPITLQSLRRLSFASEPTVPLYRFSFLGLGGIVDYNRAIHLINFLDTYGAIDIDARTINTMTISLRPGYLQSGDKLIGADKGIPCVSRENKTGTPTALILWHELQGIFTSTHGNQIVLRISDAGETIGSQNELEIAENPARDNLVFTGTALGALRQTLDMHTFKFLTPEQAAQLKADNDGVTNDNNCLEDQFYISEPTKASPEPIEEEWHKLFKFPFESVADARKHTRDVGSRTVLLIIETSPQRLPNSYVSVFKDGLWYSIDNDDIVTKQNFALLNNIVTVQAAPANNTPTQTTINAGH